MILLSACGPQVQREVVRLTVQALDTVDVGTQCRTTRTAYTLAAKKSASQRSTSGQAVSLLLACGNAGGARQYDTKTFAAKISKISPGTAKATRVRWIPWTQ